MRRSYGYGPRKRVVGHTTKRGYARKARVVTINGPWGSSIKLPIPKLPIRIGTDTSLGAGKSIYPVLNGLSIPIGPNVVTMAAGAMAAVINVNFGLINNWSTRFGATFDEYCIVGMALEIRPFLTAGSVDQAGYGAFFLDEKDSAAPTGANMFGSPRIEIMSQSNYNPVLHRLDWKPSDLADLQWTSTGTSTTPVYVKAYAATADTFTTASTGVTYAITGTLAVSFRGWKN